MTARTRKPRSSRERRLALIELKTAAEVSAQWSQHLVHGGALGPPGGRVHALVTRMIVGPAGMSLELPAKTVYAGDEGTGYELTGFDGALKRELAAWVKANEAPDALDHAPTTRIPTIRRGTKP
jgi:hypothetical protein